jgi:enoyl-CoA hydratase/carnithine racemase
MGMEVGCDPALPRSFSGRQETEASTDGRWAVPLRTAEDLAAGADRLDLGPDGRPGVPLLLVDLDSVDDAAADTLEHAAEALTRAGGPVLGVRRSPWSVAAQRLAPHLDLTLTLLPDPPRYAVAVADLEGSVVRITRTVADSPRASTALCHVLRAGSGLAVPDALVVESLAYSMLLAGPEFRRWRDRHPRREPPPVTEPVRLARVGDRLTVTLNHPTRRNAYGRAMRDGLVEAFELAAADPTLREVHLVAAGPVFCSGGDLDEFGTTTDVGAAHLIRVGRSAAAALHRVADKVVVHLHGSCIGAGIEIPAFAARVTAASNTVVRLPELVMGLIPGAGGTVGIARRIGRWRTAYLALTGEPVTAATMLSWGLADGLTDDPASARA